MDWSEELLPLTWPDSVEQFSQRDLDNVPGAQDSVLGLARAVVGGDPCAAGLRIDHPHVLDAHGQVIVDPLLHFRNAILRRKDLDAEQGRRLDDLLDRRFGAEYTDIRDAEPTLLNLDTAFGHDPDFSAPFVPKKARQNKSLQSCVIILTQVALQQDTVNIFPVRPVSAGQVLRHRNQHRRPHTLYDTRTKKKGVSRKADALSL